MEFRKISPQVMIIVSLLGVFLIGVILWRIYSKAEPSIPENMTIPPQSQDEQGPNASTNPAVEDIPSPGAFTEDAAIQKQLDRDREEQKQTKYLKTRLEQTNLELEQQKAFAEINKLKMENPGAFNDPVVENQRNLPEIKVQFIGGSSIKKEAILSIAGASYQVKEKSNPMDNIQIVAISDTGVTIHFSAPRELTKTFDYKPE